MTAALLRPIAPPCAGEVHVWWTSGRSRDAVRATLLAIASACTGTDAAHLRIGAADGGRPRFLGGPGNLRFSVTRTDGAAAIAFALGVDVGIDAERVRDDVDFAAVADAMFDADGAREIRAFRGPARRDAFFRSWVRREALLKCAGTGLARGAADARWADPGAPDGCFAAASAPLLRGGTATDLFVADLAAPRGFRAALAVRGAAPRAVTVRRAPVSA